MTLKRSELKRGKPMSRGASQLTRSGPIRAKAPKAQAQRVEITVRACPELMQQVEQDGAAGLVVKAAPARKRGLKSTGPKMTAIRASAKDEECTLRFPCCNHRTDTTVLCHRNGAGAGMKAADTDAAYGCYACHTVLDGHAPRPEGFTRDMMLARFEVAVELTHERLFAKKVISAVVYQQLKDVKKQKPLPAGTGNGFNSNQLIGQSMSTKIVPQINSVVSVSARSSVGNSTEITTAEVRQ
jgi:hypothetical protein